MKATIVSCLLAFFLIAGCHKRVDTSVERQELLATDIQFSKKSAEAGAAEAFNAFLADDAIQLPASSEPIQGREKIYQEMKSGVGNYTLRWEPKMAEVAQSGDMGWTWGTYTLSYNDSTNSKTINGKYVNVWRKQPDGLWKVVVDIGNQSPAPEQ